VTSAVLRDAENDPTYGYAFIWPFKEQPVIGALVIDANGKQVAVVAFGTTYTGPLKALTGIVRPNGSNRGILLCNGQVAKG
jgi:hypothetical protein